MLEICLVVLILALIATLAVPSVTGLLAERRLRESLYALDDLAATAQRRSMAEGKTYLLVWAPRNAGIQLCPEELSAKERAALPPTLTPAAVAGGHYELTLPAALVANAQAEWAFWPSGNCEPAIVRYSGPAGRWTASYQPLTARSTLVEFHPR